MLTRSGYIVNNPPPELKKELTVRAIVNDDFGFPPPPFKVFRPTKNGICVPRYYGISKLGEPTEDKRPEPTELASNFTEPCETPPIRTPHLLRLLTQVTGPSLPCGFGKTTVSLAIACKLGYRTMIIVHKEFLANQWEERIKQFCPGATIGRVQQNKKDVECDFVIAMLQSLSLKEYTFGDFDSIGTLIVDEAHHICAKVFSQSLFKMCPKHIFGLSATQIEKMDLRRSFTGSWDQRFLL